MLTLAYERQAHQARLRNEITRSKAEQGEYLRNVELARVLDKRQAKKAQQSEESGSTDKPSSAPSGDNKHKRTYKQRQAVDKEAMREKGMEGVLGSVFG